MKRISSISRVVAILATLIGDSIFPTGASIIRMFPFTYFTNQPPTWCSPANCAAEAARRGIPYPTSTPVPTYKPYTVTPIYIPQPLVYSPLPIYVPHVQPIDYSQLPATTSTPKKPAVLGVSTTDRKAADFIPSKMVPTIVERIFGEVFGTGRKIDPKESTYWKFRARTDKATESKLKGAMYFALSKGFTYMILPQ